MIFELIFFYRILKFICVLGVTIRLEYYVGLMHHKFAIVDNDILITGSTNWTMSAFFGNFDHIIVTNQHSLVKPFIDEFDRLWKTFSNSQENIECPAQFSIDNNL